MTPTTACCGAAQRGLRCTGCGHRQPVNGVPPVETRRRAAYGLKPWVAVAELAGRALARRAGRKAQPTGRD